MKIWMIINDEPSGPMSVDEALAAGLSEDTMVWYAGLPDWKRAADVDGLRPYLEGAGQTGHRPAAIPVPAVPDVPVRPEDDGPVPPMPPTYLVWSILATVLCCLIPGIVAIIYSTRISSAYFSGDYERAKRYSEMAEWWIMITIVAGLVWAPFSVIFMSI